MSDKTKKLIIGITVYVLLAVAGLTFMYLEGREQLEDIFSGNDITENADEVLLNMGKEKAPKAAGGLWLIENKDISFTDSQALERAAGKIDKQVFSHILLSFESLLEGDGRIGSEELKKLQTVAQIFEGKGFSVYCKVPLNCHISAVAEIMKHTDGMIVDGEDAGVDKLNNKLLAIKAVCTADTKYKVYAIIDLDTDTVKFNKKSVVTTKRSS